ncbi:D-beta-hydroxybutyrate dehydrogenase, mitochondrial [Agrilus planipennis]|uniref:D-beta-hydroxybutyrate dehydrogenase, mitochondrial n=1 Tax=Agrilus planipennis TaxID=224129 RepID=A0A1W4WEA4_AGRPL|nr:D-beta-hydroxybutyrate dehydrogenase, mitochondrial [Agrilus planipennis]
MSGPFKRRPSLKKPPSIGLVKSPSRRRSSAALLQPIPQSQQEVPWDLLDRVLPLLFFCHGTALILSNILNLLRISQVTTFTLFIWFTIVTLGAVLFYHNLKVTVAGKAILITGCDSRIGSALARYLDDLGFTVFAGFQNAADNPLAQELKEESSGRLHVLQLDVSSETQILAASLYAVEHLPDGAPGLWAVINAASWIALGEIEWLPPQIIRKATELNFLGPTRLIQIMLPLIRRARGRIVFMTSGLASVASPVRGIHSALLNAIEAEASCLRQELRPRGVEVIVVAPGEYTAGSSWLSDDDIRDQAQEMWLQLCHEQRKSYGEDYFETAVRSLEKFTKGPEADLSPVLRSLTDSVVKTFPLPKYTPITRQEKIQSFIANHLPQTLYNIIYN